MREYDVFRPATGYEIGSAIRRIGKVNYGFLKGFRFSGGFHF